MALGAVRTEAENTDLFSWWLTNHLPLVADYNLSKATGSVTIKFPRHLGGRSITIDPLKMDGFMFLGFSESVSQKGRLLVSVPKMTVNMARIDLPVIPGINGNEKSKLLDLKLRAINQEFAVSGFLDWTTGEIEPLQVELALEAYGPLSDLFNSASDQTLLRLTLEERINVADGVVQGTGTGKIASGVLKGTSLIFAHGKPPPDIACGLNAEDCLQCTNPGAACRVNGTNGTCQQVAGGCACRAGGQTLRIWRCAD